MSSSARAGKASRNFSRALARQTILSIIKCATGVTYRPIVFLRQRASGCWPHFKPPFFSATMDAEKKVLPFVELMSERRGGGSSEVEWARPDAREGRLWQKGPWRGVDISSRYYCPRALTVQLNLSFVLGLVRWRRRARPQAELSLGTMHHRLVCIRQINCRSWVIDDVQSRDTCDPLSIGEASPNSFWTWGNARISKTFEMIVSNLSCILKD